MPIIIFRGQSEDFLIISSTQLSWHSVSAGHDTFPQCFILMAQHLAWFFCLLLHLDISILLLYILPST